MATLEGHQTPAAAANIDVPAFLRRSPELPGVALVGRAGTGKTSLAAWLAEEYRYRRHSWADGVRAVAAMAYGPVAKDELYTVTVGGFQAAHTGRWLLQRIGTEALRDQVDRDFWIKAGLRRMEPGRKYVNDDTRFPNEAAALRALGFVVVRLEAPDDVRAMRLGLSPDDLARTEEHSSEYGQDTIEADLTLRAVGPVEAYAADLVGWLRRRQVA